MIFARSVIRSISALRAEVPRRRGPARTGQHGYGDPRGGRRHQPVARLAARARAHRLWRPGVLEGGRPAGLRSSRGANRRPTSKAPLSGRWRLINRARSRTRARGEHAFRIIKQLWGFTKVRYRGLAKNLAKAHTMFALANLSLVRNRLLPAFDPRG